MDGIHDLGGMDGFGPVEAEPDEPVFHASWEERTFAMTRATMLLGAWTIDSVRDAGERIPPATYLNISYYERWLANLVSNVVAHGFVGEDELAVGHALRPGALAPRSITEESLSGAMTRPLFTRDTDRPARFHPGDWVRARNIHPTTHTRLPGYIRGHLGVVELVHGCHVFPDALLLGQGEDPQWLYTARFSGTELWGEEGDLALSVSVDVFEPYLEPAAA